MGYQAISCPADWTSVSGTVSFNADFFVDLPEPIESLAAVLFGDEPSADLDLYLQRNGQDTDFFSFSFCSEETISYQSCPAEAGNFRLRVDKYSGSSPNEPFLLCYKVTARGTGQFVDLPAGVEAVSAYVYGGTGESL